MIENNIDGKYYVNVARIMKLKHDLPRPAKKCLPGDGEILPIVVVSW